MVSTKVGMLFVSVVSPKVSINATKKGCHCESSKHPVGSVPIRLKIFERASGFENKELGFAIRLGLVMRCKRVEGIHKLNVAWSDEGM